MLPISAAPLHHNAQGVPYSDTFDDVYHSTAGGLGQAEQVFLAGNGLPHRWAQQASFTILETGFGLGLNFLTTWAKWRDDLQRCKQFYYISVEKFPFSAKDLQDLHQQWPQFAELSELLCKQWPPLIAGWHKLELEHGVTLLLLFGDAHDVLPQLQANVDAFYLDGFSPAKNPELWNETIFRQLARVAKAGATLATYTVAGHVRRGLQACGFAVEKREGFGGKRQSLAGVYERRVPIRQPHYAVNRAIVIGAGIAGCAAAERLAARGWQIDVIEQEAEIAQHASGNHAGVVMPTLSLDDNLLARFSRAGFFYTLRRWQVLTDAGQVLPFQRCGVLQVGRDAAHTELQQAIIEKGFYPPALVSWLNADEASERLGVKLARGGWWFPDGAWVQPPAYCRALLTSQPQRIQLHLQRQVKRLAQLADGQWQIFDAHDHLIATAPVVIFANATAARDLAPCAGLPLAENRRFVSLLKTTVAPKTAAILCGDGYLTPNVAGYAVLGASEVGIEQTSDRHHQQNLHKLTQLLPDVDLPAITELNGRYCQRPTSPDRLPLIGALASTQQNLQRPPERIQRTTGLFCALGFGARGLTWASLAGDILASQIQGEPMPVEQSLLHAVDPMRFAMRAARRGQSD